MDFNLEYYRAFYYAAKFGSYSKAAEHLYLTQPAVSQSIHRLENSLGGCKLFIRNSHGMDLTPEGKLLFIHVDKAFELLTAGEVKLSRFNSLENSDLYIGATDTALDFHVLPHVNAFSQRYPRISLHIQGCHSGELLEMLKAGKIDVAFGVTPVSSKSGFTFACLQTFQDVFIAGSAFSDLALRELDPKELTQFPLVVASPGSSFSGNLTRWLQQEQLEWQPRFHVLTTSYILPFVQNNIAIGCVPELFARQWIQQGQIAILKVRKLPPRRSIFAASNPALPLSAASREFIRIMEAEADSQKTE